MREQLINANKWNYRYLLLARCDTSAIYMYELLKEFFENTSFLISALPTKQRDRVYLSWFCSVYICIIYLI